MDYDGGGGSPLPCGGGGVVFDGGRPGEGPKGLVSKSECSSPGRGGGCLTGCGLNEMAVDVKGLTLSKGEGGGQIESSSIPEKSKSLDHIIESQNAPSHLPEKILLTEKSEVLETSSEMEFSGGSGNIFGVTVGGQDTPCELQELSEGYLADSSGLSKEQRNVGTQRRLQETKKSPEGQKNSEFGDLRSSPTQFSKRQKIESFSGVSVLQNSESVEFFGEKLGSFPPVSQIPEGITDTQSQQDLRGMGSPLHEAPSLGTGGEARVRKSSQSRFISENNNGQHGNSHKIPFREFCRKSKWFSMENHPFRGFQDPQVQAWHRQTYWVPPKGGVPFR